MILYEGTIERFNDDVMQNCIADRAAEKYRTHYNRNPGDAEYRSWAYSLAILNNSFTYAGLKDNHIAREKELKTGFGRKWLKREIKAGRARQAGGLMPEEIKVVEKS